MSGQYIPNIQIPQAVPIDVMGAMQRGQQYRGNALAMLAQQNQLQQQTQQQNALAMYAGGLGADDPTKRRNSLQALMGAAPNMATQLMPMLSDERDRAEMAAIMAGAGGGAQPAATPQAAPAAVGAPRGPVALPPTYQPPQGVDRNVDLMARTILGEAANQGLTGMTAVGHVIQNRARAAGMSPEQVVLAGGQFEPWGNPATQQRLLTIDPNSPQYRQARTIAEQVLAGQVEDPTRGGTHFFAPRAQAALGRQPPTWAEGQEAQVIGDHNFYRLPYGGATGAGSAGGSGGAGGGTSPQQAQVAIDRLAQNGTPGAIQQAARIATTAGQDQTSVAGLPGSVVQAITRAALSGNPRAIRQLQLLQPMMNRETQIERVRLPDGSEMLVPRQQAAGMVSAAPPRDTQFVDLGDDGPEGAGRYAVENGRLRRQAAIPRDDQTFARSNTLRDEYVKLTEGYRTVEQAYRQVETAARSGSGQGDMAMLYAFVRMLDPTSVVRESEFAMAAQTGSFGERVQGAVQRVLSGERLPSDVRQNFLGEARNILRTRQEEADTLADNYRELARRNSLRPEDVVMPFGTQRAPGRQTGQPTAQPAPGGAQTAPAAGGGAVVVPGPGRRRNGFSARWRASGAAAPAGREAAEWWPHTRPREQRRRGRAPCSRHHLHWP
ncbi:cell wall hydrolase [Roseomonas hellenica]|uniref:Cell wall hydrolase n=1 Tax=Plastoroseomonas hellenica TaxID=2687306 RepID=A0ABS5F6T7_9PROT|nr:cell wall hydrolase [Plastoroseomonas hellenica]MBR0668267.1 cell wall hydrolase [Plastoroseomonas hellenica]